jgi:hypothetical protein
MSTPAGLRNCEVSVQKEYRDVWSVPGAVCDSGHKLLVAKIHTRFKKIIKFQKGKQEGIWRSYVLKDRKCKII